MGFCVIWEAFLLIINSAASTLDLGTLRTIKGQNLPNSKKNFRRLASKQSYLVI